MDFRFSSEQELLRETLSRLLRASYNFEARQQIVRSNSGYSDAVWQALGEMGVLALPFAEDRCGLGGKPSDLVAVSLLFGRHLLVEPFLSSSVLGGQALALGGSESAALLEGVVAGAETVSLAHEETHGIGVLGAMATVLNGEPTNLRLEGAKCLVLDAARAKALVVTARHCGRLCLVLVDPRAEGVSLQSYVTTDGRRAAHVRFESVKVGPDDILLEDAGVELESVIGHAHLVLSAEAVGAMQALFEISVAYASTRKQFGAPIASFQAVSHRLADMKIACVQCFALLVNVAALADTGKAMSRDFALLKAQVGRLGRKVGESAIQVHGGIGMTDELPVGHLFKRLVAIDTMLGNADYHFRSVGAAGLMVHQRAATTETRSG